MGHVGHVSLYIMWHFFRAEKVFFKTNYYSAVTLPSLKI